MYLPSAHTSSLGAPHFGVASSSLRTEPAQYLEKHGEIDNFTALSVGIPPVGRILRLGARIHGLRHMHGYEIATEQQPDKNTVYRLISSPKAKQLPLAV